MTTSIHEAEDRPDEYEQALFDADVNEFFETAFAMADRGEISLKQVGDFFPQEVRERNKRLV